MSCQNCKSDQLFQLNSKASDRHSWTYGRLSGDGYAPDVPHVCRGDYVRVCICLNCGQTQGQFPVTLPTELTCDPVADAISHYMLNHGSETGDHYYFGEMNPSYLSTDNGYRFWHDCPVWACINTHVFVKTTSSGNNIALAMHSIPWNTGNSKWTILQRTFKGPPNLRGHSYTILANVGDEAAPSSV